MGQTHAPSRPAMHTYVVLHGKYAVLRELMEAVVAVLDSDLTLLLDEDRAYTAKALCGRPFWDLLDLGERKLVGSCISHLVSQGTLPLVRVNEFKKYPNRYRLRQTSDR